MKHATPGHPVLEQALLEAQVLQTRFSGVSSRIERDVARAYDLEANSFIQKPVDFEAFRTAVRNVAGYWLDLNEPPPVARNDIG